MRASKHLKIHPDNLHQQQNRAALYLQKWWCLGPTVESQAAQSRSPPAAETGKRSRAPNRWQRWRSPALQTPAEHRRCCRSAGTAVQAAGMSSVGTPRTCKHNSRRCEHKCGALPAGQYSSQPTTNQPANKSTSQPIPNQPTNKSTSQPTPNQPAMKSTRQHTPKSVKRSVLTRRGGRSGGGEGERGWGLKDDQMGEGANRQDIL